MIPLLSSSQALALDAEVEKAWRLESGVLMESAAHRLAHALIERIGPPDVRPSPRIVAAAGGGNNGGDALALLRNLAFAGYRDLAAVIPGREAKPLCARQAASLVAGGIPVVRWNSEEGHRALAGAEIILDGIAGTGLSAPLAGEPADFVGAVNSLAREVYSIDLPSGFRDEAGPIDPRVMASVTLSLEPRKLSLYAPSLRPLAGRIVAVEDVFPRRPALGNGLLDWIRSKEAGTWLLQQEDIPNLLFHASEWSHKGNRGRLAIFAGSPGMAGALFLAARAAQAAGVGLVTLYVRDEMFKSLGTAGPESIGGAIIRPESTAQAEISRQDAILAGPGWGRDASRKTLLSFLLDTELPLVLDADALRILHELESTKRKAPLILTPHPGEFEALTGHPSAAVLASPQEPLAGLARNRGAFVALKTATTWLMAPDGRFGIIDGGEAGLAVAGSGDVLAGLIAGLLARYTTQSGSPSVDDAFAAASLAILVHLEAGRALRREEGWFEASRLISGAAAILGRPRKS